MESLSIQQNRISLWSLVYLLIVLVVTVFSSEPSTPVNVILCLLTLPFYKNEERLLEVCIILSSISYYYANGDEQILSVYTMLCLFCIVRAMIERRFNKALFIIPRVALMFVLYLSFQQSSLATFNGFMELVYIVVISIVISLCIRIDHYRPLRQLHVLACINIIFLMMMLAINPISDGARMQFSADVNANSFGFASAAMTLFVAHALIMDNSIRHRKLELIICLVGGILTFLSGSRNSLLALIVAILFIFFKKYGIANMRKYLPYVVGIAITVLAIIPIFGLDSTRFSISSVVESGGSNRTHIWEEMIPYVVQNNFYLGNGPGKAGSTILLSDMVSREYNSTHNTFIEAFAETGIIGLTLFSIIFVYAIISLRKKTQLINGYLLLSSSFIFLLAASIGESYYNDVFLWMFIGLAGYKL